MTRTPPWQVAMDQRLFKAHAVRKPTSLVLFDGVHARDYGAIPDISWWIAIRSPGCPWPIFPAYVMGAQHCRPRKAPLRDDS